LLREPINTLPTHGLFTAANSFLLDTQADSNSCRSYDIAIILKSLDLYLCECGKAEAGKIDFITYNKITDMAATYRILAALRMHRPSVSLRYSSLTEVMKTRDSTTSRLWRHKEKMLEILENPRKFRFGTAFHILDKYRMPSGKKNEQWLDRANSAVSFHTFAKTLPLLQAMTLTARTSQQRQALSDVWSTARKHYTNMYRDLNFSISDIDDMARMLSHHDSADYLAMVMREKNEILASIAQSTLKAKRLTVDSLPYQSSSPHISASKEAPEKGPTASLEAKLKPKTRPENSPLDTDSPDGANSEPDSGPQPCPGKVQLPLPKKAKSLDTLRLLFPTAISDLQGTIQWVDFVATMNELGFQSEHRGGSEWTFRSFGDGLAGGMQTILEGSGQVKKSIVIHQPHPDQKMGAVRLQQIGKRLWRRFGWERQRFEGL